LYLLTRLKDSKTLGLYIKDSNGYHWDRLFIENGKVKAEKGTTVVPIEVSGFSADEITYIGKMNGVKNPGYTTDSHGMYQVVSDFTPSQKITESTILCGKVKIDFTGSQYFDKLPADVKSKIQSGTWPSDFPGNPVMYLKYSNGYDAGGNWQGFANASFGSQNFRIPVQNDGTFRSENLRGLPIGKYKLVGVVYIRNDNPDDQNSISRLDSPASGWWKDYVSDWTAVDKSIDIFVTNKYEVEVKETGNSGSGFEGNGECVDLTYTYKGQIDPSSALSKSSDDLCNGQGSGISAMINEGLCGLTVVLKGAADKFFLWAVSWMEKSIGIARNEDTTTSESTQKNFSGTIKFIADPGEAGGKVGPASLSLYQRFKNSPSTISVGIWPANSAIDDSSWADATKKMPGKLASSEFIDDAAYPKFKFQIAANSLPDTSYTLVVLYQNDNDNTNYDGTFFFTKTSDLLKNSQEYNSFPFRNK
jgi:hypothetical protein